MLNTRILLRNATDCLFFGHDLSAQLHEFSRLCALDVIDLWKPSPTVREYLTTDNPELREKASELSYTTTKDLTRQIWALPEDQEWTDEIHDLHAACDASHLTSFVGMHDTIIAAWVCTWQASRAASYHSKYGFQGAVEMEARHRHRLNKLINSAIQLPLGQIKRITT